MAWPGTSWCMRANSPTVMRQLDPGYDVAFFDGLTPSRPLLKEMRRLLRARGLLISANLTHAGARGLSRCLARQEILAYRLHRRGPRDRAQHQALTTRCNCRHVEVQGNSIMSIQAILLPLFVQVALTFALLFWMASCARTRFERGEVQIRATSRLREPNWPPRAQQVANSFSNQFELPVLFYVLTDPGDHHAPRRSGVRGAGLDLRADAPRPCLCAYHQQLSCCAAATLYASARSC